VPGAPEPVGAEGMRSVLIRVAADHPCGEGHFPGNPIVPGAVLLDEVLATIESETGRPPTAWTVVAAKFSHPVRPGQPLRLSFEPGIAGAVRFECTLGDKVVLSGRAHPTEGEPD